MVNLNPILIVLICLGLRISEAAPPVVPGAVHEDALPGIVGKDDRVPLDSTQWPWQAIGRINQPDARGHCTGTLVAPDRVLTAVHCLYDQKTHRWFSADEISFVANPRRDEDAGFSRGKRIIKTQNQPPGSDAASIQVDWAILVLEHPLHVRPIPIDTIELKAAFHLMTAGYPKDRPYLLDVDPECAVKNFLADDAILVTDCDSTSGDSGAPLLLREGTDYRVIGVFSAATLANAIDPKSFAVNATTFKSLATQK